MKKLLLLVIAFISMNSMAQKTEADYYKEAKDRLETQGVSHLVKRDISKAIEFNPDNTEYRWIRARCNMTNNSTSTDFKQAIDDINYILEKETPSAKLYTYLGFSHQKLGFIIYQSKKAKKNDGFSDDNSEYIKEQTLIYNEAIANLKEANKTYAKAFEIDPDTKKELDSDFNYNEKIITEIENKIKQL